MQRIYIAGPLFNTHERWYLEQLAAAVEQAGYTTFLPHRDAGLVDFTLPGAQARIFRDDITALDGCDWCIALLTGADQDSGTSAELGYMYAQGKRCFGLSDDFRFRNNMIWGICGEGTRIAKDIPGLIALLGQQEAIAAPPTEVTAPVADLTAPVRSHAPAAECRIRRHTFVPAADVGNARLDAGRDFGGSRRLRLRHEGARSGRCTPCHARSASATHSTY
ncbi:MAG: nucleoside 2-deoxyribosyltransferase [Blastochloris sp.]|nr:nucleoside 2-deoxyribosyltransferase [Blastochloris sp.]